MNARDWLLRQRAKQVKPSGIIVSDAVLSEDEARELAERWQRDRTVGAILPQRQPGAVLNVLRQNCAACVNGTRCDYHWAVEHVDQDECACCAGRYSRCRNAARA